MNKGAKIRNFILLFITAGIWGTAFVAQSVGMEYIKPITFVFCRSAIAAIFLAAFLIIRQKALPRYKEKTFFNKKLIIYGVICGTLLFSASALQQIGMLKTTVGKAGFITAFYIILVPVLGVFLKKKCGLLVWIAVVMSLGGLYLLCVTESLSIGAGDLLILACAFLFSCHIICVDSFVTTQDGVKISLVQFITCSVIGVVLTFIFDGGIDAAAIKLAAKPLLYAGVMSSGVAYTLQIVGQKGINPTIASLIMSLESVVSVISGFLILGQNLTQRELIGCAIMLCAIALAQLPQDMPFKARYKARSKA